MDIEEVDEKRPRFLWIVVVAVVAAALAVFILIQSGRMKRSGEEAVPERQVAVERASGPVQPAWPAADTARAEERVQVREPAPESPAVTAPAEKVKAPPEARTSTPPPAKKPAVTEPAAREGRPIVLPTSDSGPFVVQVGSYKDERVAKVQVAKMKDFGYDAWIESADVPGKGRYHRVRIGGFDTMADADRVAQSMSAVLGNNCWVANR